jgi:hypothetical protein
MPRKLREASAFWVSPPNAEASIPLVEAKAAYAELLREACRLGDSPLTDIDISEDGALQLETIRNYLKGKTAPPSKDRHDAFANLLGKTLALKRSKRASEFDALRKKLDAAWVRVRYASRKIKPKAPEPCTSATNPSMQVAVLAAMQIGTRLRLATQHLRRFGLPLLFTPWEGFADNGAMARDMFARLEPIDFDLVRQLAPLGMEPGLRITKGFEALATARRLLEDSLPSGGVSGVVRRIPWTHERDAEFNALLHAALIELEEAAELCRKAGKAAGVKQTSARHQGHLEST